MTHPLDEASIPDLSREMVHMLAGLGIGTVEDLAATDPVRIAAPLGLPLEEAARLVEVARANLPGALGPDVIPFQQEPPSVEELSRGLLAARAIEHTAGLARKLRSHVGKRPTADTRWTHKRARRQLKKLQRTLEDLQHEVLARGLGTHRLDAIQGALVHLDRVLESLLGRDPLDRETLRDTRKAAKRSRKAIQEL